MSKFPYEGGHQYTLNGVTQVGVQWSGNNFYTIVSVAGQHAFHRVTEEDGKVGRFAIYRGNLYIAGRPIELGDVVIGTGTLEELNQYDPSQTLSQLVRPEPGVMSPEGFQLMLDKLDE